MKSLLLLLLTLFLSSCANRKTDKENVDTVRNQINQSASLIPAHMRAKKDLDKEFPTEEPTSSPFDDIFGNQQTTQVEPSTMGEISAEELIWTDPDNPDKNLGEVEAAFTQPIKDSWQLSYQAAQRLAYAEGKPLLIWFTDSRRSAICKRLDAEVLNTHEFKNWSEDNVVKLRVDLSPREINRDLRDQKIKYAQALRKKFNISGSPYILVMDFEGQAFGRYKGYRANDASFYLGRLKQAAKTINEGYFDWAPKMEKRGYRNWEGSNGVELFAKLLRYSDGRLQVVEPNGRKTIFSESNLSSSDRKWIQKQKESRLAQ